MRLAPHACYRGGVDQLKAGLTSPAPLWKGGRLVAAEDYNGERSPQGVPTEADHSLDSLARGLADGSLSRRKALRLMGAALVGAALASIPGVAWAAKCQPGEFKCG